MPGGEPADDLLLAHQNKADLAVLHELLDTGKVTPVIDRTYPLSAVAEAIGYLEQGRARGKVVITTGADRVLVTTA